MNQFVAKVRDTKSSIIVTIPSIIAEIQGLENGDYCAFSIEKLNHKKEGEKDEKEIRDKEDRFQE